MKKIRVGINLVLLLFVVAACSTKKQISQTVVSKNQSKKIDQELVNQIVGTWYGDQPENYGEYQILKEEDSLLFKEKEFQIIKTNRSIVYTKENQKQDKEWYCDFNLDEK